ncbi:MAG: GNAT family N-acetyltransferase, partial [Planctomycetia bacterium]|nr:GNAT family N-acetyltransferase [Planctomycetia bacterium]
RDDPPVPTAEFAGVLRGRPGREVHAWLALDGANSAGAAVRGFVALVVAGRRYSIGWLLVHPAARRRGIGTALVDHAVAEAALLGAREVHADTLSDWPSAVAFWDRMAERHA